MSSSKTKTTRPNGHTRLIAPRVTFGETLARLGTKNRRLVVLDADLSTSTKTSLFRDRFPNRFFQMGIAEQNMVGAAAGLSLQGFIPIVSTFAAFATRAWEQFRLSVAVPKLNVKLVVTHAGVTVGADGVSAQMTEDIALMRTLPHVTVLSPADAIETSSALVSAINHIGPVYLRLGRPAVPVIHSSRDKFRIGRAEVLSPGTDVTLIATGLMVAPTLTAAHKLKTQGVSSEVINLSTIKPLDHRTILKSVSRTQAVVTAEDHQQAGGMGSAVAELLAQNLPSPIEMVALDDTFGQSGTSEELAAKFGLTPQHIITAATKALSRKTNPLPSRKSTPAKPSQTSLTNQASL